LFNVFIGSAAPHCDLDAAILNRARQVPDSCERQRRPSREPARFVIVADTPDDEPRTGMAAVEHAAQVFIVAGIRIGFVEKERRSNRFDRAKQGRGSDIRCGERPGHQVRQHTEKCGLTAAFFRCCREQPREDRERIESMHSEHPKRNRVRLGAAEHDMASNCAGQRIEQRSAVYAVRPQLRLVQIERPPLPVLLLAFARFAATARSRIETGQRNRSAAAFRSRP
jgi:hypothetical protein